jgi:steroid delta-isomerase-like uncharacterized protein
VATLDADTRLRLVEQHVEAENSHDVDRIMSTVSDAPRWIIEAIGDDLVGYEAIRARHEELLGAFPDLSFDIEKRHVTDEAVIVEVLVRGTHLGKWRGLPPLGRSIEFRVCNIFTVDENGKIECEHEYFDKSALLEQLQLHHDPETGLGRVMAVLTPPFAILRALPKSLVGRRKHKAVGRS